ncbi:hypothetical protein [Janibacter sp. GS2]|uniref:hypothetical protein n=1 Tax=Janibacter sp. GS2 TaxID=3442646 RepID=UPI003EBF7B70
MIDVPADLFTDLLALPDAIFTRQDALRAGVRDEVLIGALRRGRIARLCRGAYTSPGPWTKGEQRRLLARAALRVYEDAVLTSATAVAAHGIPLFEVPVVRADIARPITREAGTTQLRIRPLRDEPVDTDWGPAVPLAPALLQMTMDHGIPAGVASIDAALHVGATEREVLAAGYERVSGWPHSSRARCALAWSDGRSESLGESVTRVILRGAGWGIDSQVPIVDRHGEVFARADLGVEGTRVLVEFDGKVKYTEGGPDALFREKQREDRIRALGYVVVRVTWADLFHPERIIRAVRGALAVAA